IAEGITLYEPTFTSDWITVEAQDDNKCEFYVPFLDGFKTTTRPVKVIVEVKVEDDGESFIFNAFGSSPRDDDKNEEYGGVVYFYNASGVLIFLPNRYRGDDDGKAVYLGIKDVWYQPTSHSNEEVKNEFVDAEVRVKMWRYDDLPPQYDSGFIYTIESGHQDKTHLEVPINLTSNPDMIVVQAEPITILDEMPGLIAEGGGVPGCLGCGEQAGGLSFAYNASHVRLWVKLNYPITSAADGWGDEDYPTEYRLMSSEVKVRILAWTFDNAVNTCQWKETLTTDIAESVQTTPKMIFTREVVTEASLVMVKIRPVDGPNVGFSFYGAGSVVTSGSYDASKRYTGLVFGYNNFGVYVWRVKPTSRSFVFDISSPWGGGKYSQQTNDVEIDIIVLGKMSREIYCPSLIPPQHGGLIQNTSVGGTAYFYCNPGFQLSGGDSNLTCLDNGTWVGDPVICSEILCPVIENPENGIVTLSNNNSMTNIGMSGVPFNTIATFSCNPGYYIAASVSIFKRTCLVNGSWDGAPFSCSEILCPELDEAPNSTITHINRSINGTVRYKCNKGYILANGSLQRKCTSYGEWDGRPPNCTALGQCMCPCNMVHEPKYTNTSDEALIREIEKMREELLVLETSAALRKKISVKDFRPSTNASGSVWVTLLLIMAALIIVPDVLSALRYVKIVYTRRLISREIK
ncbi:uncharacterized protein LOC133204790, partial [Saccostrea echinata]|uniref:uncharacterized protein LOC133204790 n=1 Tax=Saccostrea echinata TaxID=191078 RepID=UPI002A82F851